VEISFRHDGREFDVVEQIHYLRLRVARRALRRARATEIPPAALVRVADFIRSSVILVLSPCALLGESGGLHPQVRHTYGGTQPSSPHSQKQAVSDSPMQ
jgi:hypothetical protein